MQHNTKNPYNLHYEIPFINRFCASTLFVLNHIFKSSKLLEKWRLINIKSAISKMKINGHVPGRVIPIERRVNLSPAEFFKNYRDKNLPVIFQGEALDWPCTQNWNIDFFEKTIGQDVVSFYESSGLVEKSIDKYQGQNTPVLIEELSANHFVNDLKSGLNKYLRFSLIIEQYPKLIEDFKLEWLKKMGPCYLGVGYQTFIGAAKRMTPLHAGATAFFYIMADGEKKWRLFSANSSAFINPIPAGRSYALTDVNVLNPNLEKYPGFDLLTKYEAHLKKGDILFVPAWMWHEVENETISWGVSYRITDLTAFVRYPDFAIARLFFSKPSFFLNLFNTVVLKKRSWAKLE